MAVTFKFNTYIIRFRKLYSLDEDLAKFVITKSLELGADINAPDQDGNTLLHHAAMRSYRTEVFLDFIHFIVLKGADVNIQNERGYRPIDLAESGPLIKFLLKICGSES